MAEFGPPGAEKLIFSDKTLGCSIDLTPKHIWSRITLIDLFGSRDTNRMKISKCWQMMEFIYGQKMEVFCLPTYWVGAREAIASKRADS